MTCCGWNYLDFSKHPKQSFRPLETSCEMLEQQQLQLRLSESAPSGQEVWSTSLRKTGNNVSCPKYDHSCHLPFPRIRCDFGRNISNITVTRWRHVYSINCWWYFFMLTGTFLNYRHVCYHRNLIWIIRWTRVFHSKCSIQVYNLSQHMSQKNMSLTHCLIMHRHGFLF